MFKKALKIFFFLTHQEKYARFMGVKMGSNCHIARAKWGSEPFLIEIGDHVHITTGVSFVNHDGGVWVFRDEIPGFDVFGKIKIGNNTYIGNNAMIMPGVTIGNNCVIGAYSLITKSIPDNSVVAGVPAKYICNIEEYKSKMLKLNLNTKKLSVREKINAIKNMPQDKQLIKVMLRTS